MNEQENVQHEINKEENSQDPQKIEVVITKVTEKKEKSRMATASMVLGIIAICLPFITVGKTAFAPGVYVISILATVFGVISLVNNRGKGKAIAGLVCAVLSSIICLAFVILSYM